MSFNPFAAIKKRLPHRYAIDAKALGDAARLPWSNLGLWSAGVSYPQACQALADHLAYAVQLQAHQRVLDIGCGQGASLLHWREQYGVQDLTGLELQPRHVALMRQYLPSNMTVLAGSYVDLPHQTLPAFDTVICIDAAYHLPLGAFLQGIQPFTHAQSRVGLHYLMLSPAWYTLRPQAQRAYHLLLKAADIALQNLTSEQHVQTTLQAYGWQQIEIEDLSQAVLAGFAQYMQQHHFNSTNSRWDAFKIRMTGKLCQKLAQDGVLCYVQITAQKSA